MARPQLVPDTVSTITLKPLGAHLRGFPVINSLGWGQRAMGLDRVPPSFDGAGVRIAIIDSGAAQRDASQPGFDGPQHQHHGAKQREAWSDDVIGRGSHCAGIISGGPLESSGGIRGFAPAAEVRICRIFPGGRFSNLVGALDYCMENDINLVNMSLGGGDAGRHHPGAHRAGKGHGHCLHRRGGQLGGAGSIPRVEPSCSGRGRHGEGRTPNFPRIVSMSRSRYSTARRSHM